MTAERKRPQRRSIRLRNHDYSAQGAYFVTLCTFRRECLFGAIEYAEFTPNTFGDIVRNHWNALPDHYPAISLDSYVTMPNHLHGVILIGQETNNHPLSEIIRGFKTFSAREINKQRQAPGRAVWQRGYFEHIIRSDAALEKVRRYIETNPANWATDRENPSARRAGLKPAPTRSKIPATSPKNEGVSIPVGAGFKPARHRTPI